MSEADQPNAVQVAPGVTVPERILRFRYAGSGGPGGQSVNKLATKAVLTVDVEELAAHIGAGPAHRLRRQAAGWINRDGKLIISSDEHRSQRANHKACLEKLRQAVIRARQRPRPRKKTRPTRGSVERRLDSKKRRGQRKSERRNNRFKK